MVCDEDGPDITRLLAGMRSGDENCKNQLAERVFAELRRMAAARMRAERANHTLQPTALVNEAWIRLVGATSIDWQSRAHFFAMAATVMRRYLVDYARREAAAKKGGHLIRVELSDGLAAAATQNHAQLIALDDALNELANVDPRAAKTIELRYFSGMTVLEAAEVLGVSDRTVKRDTEAAEMWLRARLRRTLEE